MCDGVDSVIVLGRWKQTECFSGVVAELPAGACSVNSCLLLVQHSGPDYHLLWITHRPFCLCVWQPAKQIRWNRESTNGCMITGNDNGERERDTLLCVMFPLLCLSSLSSFVFNSLCSSISANDQSKQAERGGRQGRAVIKPCIF